MEKLIFQIYKLEMGREPTKPLLGEVLRDNQFTKKLDRRLLSRMNAIRDVGNLGSHGVTVEPTDAVRVLEDLCEILDWCLNRYNAANSNSGVDQGLSRLDITLGGAHCHPASYANSPHSFSMPSPDSVDCTVFSPPKVWVSQSVMVQIWVHTPEQANDATSKAISYDDAATVRGDTSLGTPVGHGSKLLFYLSMPGSRIDKRWHSLVWQGKPASVQFRVTIPQDYSDSAIHGTVTVSNEDVPLGEITFKLQVLKRRAQKTQPVPVGKPRSFNSYFVSYASADRPKVLERVQMLPRLGKQYFMDVVRLEPGDRWEPTLCIKIDESDAVLLFWSSNAKNSEWVMRECRYTISTKGIERILPVIIQEPPPVEPPPELAELHLNDPLLYVIYAENEIAKKQKEQ
jgi:hypothetical protein